MLKYKLKNQSLRKLLELNETLNLLSAMIFPRTFIASFKVQLSLWGYYGTFSALVIPLIWYPSLHTFATWKIKNIRAIDFPHVPAKCVRISRPRSSSVLFERFLRLVFNQLTRLNVSFGRLPTPKHFKILNILIPKKAFDPPARETEIKRHKFKWKVFRKFNHVLISGLLDLKTAYDITKINMSRWMNCKTFVSYDV